MFEDNPLHSAMMRGEFVKPDFSEANKFQIFNRGFKKEFNKKYEEFWKRRGLEPPPCAWRDERKGEN